ncbi:di-N-acetylchitobiase-like [Amblyraja radiata]|uniref:di-N-acetylchitobiase-like n=1 Tax=Amblyraja radiata TaxID=386614 RepID=UPI001403C321|nr:di-N-acetylchitobiase-like [Amblyraja radiata]
MAPGAAAALLFLLSAAWGSATLSPSLQRPVRGCPCSDPALCRPLAGSNQLEVFVFDVGGQDWKQYDWSKMTTIATFGAFDPELVCYAHANEVRVVLKGDVRIRDIVDQINRTAWILSKVNLAKSQFMDGINLDLEEAVTYQSVEYFVLTQLVKETTETFHREIPGSQVTFDVAWSPDCIDGRCYDYIEIANSSDFLFVMSYDMQSQMWDDCFAKANAPYYQTLSGIHAYLNLHIDPRKLVLGVPWYGYDYPCTQLFEAGRCALKNVPFRGAPCSDAAGKQIPYKKIMQQVNKSITGRFWDDDQKSPYYICMVNNTYHEVWYDDPQSISMKAGIVKKFNLRGVGMWNANLLDYGNNATAQKQTGDMWNALHPL